MLAETPEVYELVRWSQDFEIFKCLPFGSASIADEPFFVYEALLECARVKAEIEADRMEAARRDPPPPKT